MSESIKNPETTTEKIYRSQIRQIEVLKHLEQKFTALRDVFDIINLSTYKMNIFNDVILQETEKVYSLEPNAPQVEKIYAYTLVKNAPRINACSEQIYQGIQKISIANELLKIIEEDLRTEKIEDPRFDKLYEQLCGKENV